MTPEDKNRYALLMTEESERIARATWPDVPLVIAFANIIKTPDKWKEAAKAAKVRFDAGEVPTLTHSTHGK